MTSPHFPEDGQQVTRGDDVLLDLVTDNTEESTIPSRYLHSLTKEAPPVDSEPSEDRISIEDDTKKPGRDSCCLIRLGRTIIPYGGFLSGTFNFASITLGAGVISIPSAFREAGVLMATFYLAVVTSLTVYSIRQLAFASDRTGLTSFEALASGLFGRVGGYISAALMILLCFGGAVGYIMAVMNIFTVLLNNSSSTPDYLRTDSGCRLIVAMVWLVCMFPLVLPKQVNSLRYVSAVGVTFIVFFVICIVEHSAEKISREGLPPHVRLAASGNAGVSGLGLFIFSYLCQVNTFKIYYEMWPQRSVKSLTYQGLCSCVSCFTLYFFCGFFGYMDFGEEMTGSILLRFNPYKDPVFFVCYIGLIVKLCAAFSLNMLACRTALFSALRMDLPSMPYWKHSIISSCFAVPALLIGLFLSNITIVFDLVGSLCGGFIGFVFPALFVMYAGNWTLQRVGWVSFLSTYFLLFSGVVAVIFGTGNTIYSTVLTYT